MKKQLAALLLLLFAFSLSGCGEKAAESETRTVYAMDTVMNLTVYGEKAASALENAEKELHTLDGDVLSRTAEGSELSALNAANGEAVSYAADDPLPELIETALTISEATDGAFDPTLAPVLDAWGFTKDLRRVPSSDELAALLARTGRDKIALEKTADGWTVTLLDGAQLDLGGIAKVEGYTEDPNNQQLEITAKVGTVDEAKELAEKNLRLRNKFCRQAQFLLPGDTDLVAGVNVALKGWGGYDGKYIIKQAVHKLDSGGYTTQISLRMVLEGY